MTSEDQKFLEAALDSYVWAAINRVSHDGTMSHRFRITFAEFRAATNRQRLHDATISAVEQYFARLGVAVTVEHVIAAFMLDLNLSEVVLSHRQAEALSLAMETFRANHG